MRTYFRTLVAVTTIVSTVACGGGSPTAPSPAPTAAPPPTAAPAPAPTPAPGPATVTMTVEVTAAEAASSGMDVAKRGGPRQRRRARTRARLAALVAAAATATVTIDQFGCTVTVNNTTQPLDSLHRTAIVLLPGTPQVIESTNVFEFPFPVPAGDLVVSCTAQGANIVTVTASGGTPVANLTPVIDPCAANATTICAEGGRFSITAFTTNAAGQTTPGRVNAADRFPDGGYFWFFSDTNWEMLVRVLDGCRQNNRYWVFAEGRTNVEITATVTDTRTGVTQIYFNPPGQPFRAVEDTSAFATCP